MSVAADPNLVLIIADDMNWDDCGAYGHPAIRTPNIDRLAAEGLVLPSGNDGQPPKMIAAQPSGCEDWEQAIDDRPPDRPFFLWLAA